MLLNVETLHDYTNYKDPQKVTDGRHRVQILFFFPWIFKELDQRVTNEFSSFRILINYLIFKTNNVHNISCKGSKNSKWKIKIKKKKIAHSNLQSWRNVLFNCLYIDWLMPFWKTDRLFWWRNESKSRKDASRMRIKILPVVSSNPL